MPSDEHLEVIIPEFTVSNREPLYLKSIASKISDGSLDGVKRDIERALTLHRKAFGTNCLNINFDSTEDDYKLIPTSAIGRLDCRTFTLIIEAKVPGVPIGKLLLLAHRCGHSFLVRHDREIEARNTLDSENLNSIDYFGEVYCNTILDVVGNGLIHVDCHIVEPDPNLRGVICFEQTVMSGLTAQNPITSRISSTANCKTNRTLLAALQKIMISTTSETIRRLSSHLVSQLLEVVLIDNEEYDYSIESAVHRDDYERAMTFCRIILEGFDPSEGQESGFQPFFTIDMDRLFEKYMVFELKEVLNEIKYSIEAQKEFGHPTTPVLTGRGYSPDILIDSIPPRSLIVLDTKNKYSLMNSVTDCQVSNSDLFQMSYYAQAKGAKNVVLIYPGNDESASEFPLKAAEDEASYAVRVDSRFRRIHMDVHDSFVLDFPSSIRFYVWRVDLTGSIKNTQRSVAKLAQFIAELQKR